MKVRLAWLSAVCLLCCACSAPSLRYKKDVNKLLSAGKTEEAVSKVESEKDKSYSQRDRLLFYLDSSALQHDAGHYPQSDERLSQAQARIDELFATSVSGRAGQLLVNDLTLPYSAAYYETALTYYYRMMNFLQRGDISGAQVEARKAVFFLDDLRRHKAKGYNDDAFVQYFASLVFEMAGNIDDARIARTRALNAYQKGLAGTSAPSFTVPTNADKLGEIIVVHANGKVPLKRSQTVQVAWGNALTWASAAQEGEQVSAEVQNAVRAGLAGNAVTLSWPVLEEEPYLIASSDVVIGNTVQPTRLMSKVSALTRTDLDERMPGILFRTATRAVIKQIAAEQAKQAAREAAEGEEWASDAVGMLFSAFSAAVEKADTRQWFTLPAEFRMSRLFVNPGVGQVTLRFKDEFGNIVGEHVFSGVKAEPGGRVFLHYRTAR